METICIVSAGFFGYFVGYLYRRIRALEARLDSHHKAILWLVVACKQAGVGMQGLLVIQQQLHKDVQGKSKQPREKHPRPTEGQVN